MANAKRRENLNDQELIESYVDLDWERYPGGRADARLKHSGVPIWALIAHLHATGDNLDQLARDYHLPREAVDGAIAFYRQNRQYIDARILLNSA